MQGLSRQTAQASPSSSAPPSRTSGGDVFRTRPQSLHVVHQPSTKPSIRDQNEVAFPLLVTILTVTTEETAEMGRYLARVSTLASGDER